jgi:hypothetical protein
MWAGGRSHGTTGCTGPGTPFGLAANGTVMLAFHAGDGSSGPWSSLLGAAVVAPIALAMLDGI